MLALGLGTTQYHLEEGLQLSSMCITPQDSRATIFPDLSKSEKEGATALKVTVTLITFLKSVVCFLLKA